MVRFPADASLHHAIVTGCLRREPAIDFLSAHEARLEGVPDPNVLAFATRDEENRQLRENFGAESASLRKQIKRLTPKRTQVEEHHHATAKAALEQFAEFRADIEVALRHLLERETLTFVGLTVPSIPEGMNARVFKMYLNLCKDKDLVMHKQGANRSGGIEVIFEEIYEIVPAKKPALLQLLYPPVSS